jgi:tRNA A-37 threonylcarbamoyl transferase component Bud32
MGKTRRGGKRIGHGSEAFLVKPPIPCKGESGPRDGHVTRVPNPEYVDGISPDLWKPNPKIIEKLKEIDPDQSYFYYQLECDPGELTDENKKDGITDELKPYSQLFVYAPGGTWVDPKYRPRNWLEWLDGRNEQVLVSKATRTDKQKEHLTKAVKLLHDNGIHHGDLHQGNVVIAEDGLPRIIDFDRASFKEPDERFFKVDPNVNHDKFFKQALEDENETLQKLLQGKFIHTSLPRGAKRTRKVKRSKKLKRRS